MTTDLNGDEQEQVDAILLQMRTTMARLNSILKQSGDLPNLANHIVTEYGLTDEVLLNLTTEHRGRKITYRALWPGKSD